MDAPQRTRPPHHSPWSWLLVPGALALLITAYFTLPLDVFGPSHPLLSWLTFALIITIQGALLLLQVVRVMTGSPKGRPAVSIALLICLSLVVFATTYLALAKRPGEFDHLNTRVDSLYFTLVTLATVGYGDITASGQTSRVMVMIQIFYNFVFLTAGASAFSRQLRSQVATRAQERARNTPPDDPPSGR
ncbi:voltage-gated potassium channel [Kitasatospora sp. MAP12-15]|uniref:potassium channel family protein n=1 Tax=unclassified Kitasatospora TaxID=2633591 RepID=UPI002475271C|nr:potassium channel family protein [Kitasatospora sp. MAP12-44]MDH6112417.1 voltage-gated potassium channel [Kitasatospora sp. MAP12-44]